MPHFAEAQKSLIFPKKMQLSELKAMPVADLNSLGEGCGHENVGRMKRQDVIFGILKNKAKKGEDIEGGGVLEILQENELKIISI